MRTYISMFQQSGTTGAQLAQVESDAPLIELGMNSDVDRKCILLQLARVRERAKNQACAEGTWEMLSHAYSTAGTSVLHA